MNPIRFVLPLPPSVNGMYLNMRGRGRVSSPALRAWKDEAGWIVQAAQTAKLTGPFNVRIFVPLKMRGDVDGRIKAPLDLLVTHKIVPDDRFAQSVSSERCAEVKPDECIIEVSPA